jgi:hypothetical protein
MICAEDAVTAESAHHAAMAETKADRTSGRSVFMERS